MLSPSLLSTTKVFFRTCKACSPELLSIEELDLGMPTFQTDKNWLSPFGGQTEATLSFSFCDLYLSENLKPKTKRMSAGAE